MSHKVHYRNGGLIPRITIETLEVLRDYKELWFFQTDPTVLAKAEKTDDKKESQRTVAWINVEKLPIEDPYSYLHKRLGEFGFKTIPSEESFKHRIRDLISEKEIVEYKTGKKEEDKEGEKKNNQNVPANNLEQSDIVPMTSEELYSEIKRRIDVDHYKPNTFLRKKAILYEFETSRKTGINNDDARKAFELLEKDSYLMYKLGRGWMVVPNYVRNQRTEES